MSLSLTLKLVIYWMNEHKKEKKILNGGGDEVD